MSVAEVKIYSQDSKPFGRTFSEWSTRWWEWLLRIPKSINPANDFTGQNAYLSQHDPNVFFLCQTIESATQLPTRKISIPKGRSIFMPILNWISNSYKHGKTEQDLIEIARVRMDAIGDLQVNLDGRNIPGLEKYRFLSEIFTVELPEENILDLPPGQAQFVSDGYWLFMGPILKDVVMSTYGSCSSGITKIGIKYVISPV